MFHTDRLNFLVTLWRLFRPRGLDFGHSRG